MKRALALLLLLSLIAAGRAIKPPSSFSPLFSSTTTGSNNHTEQDIIQQNYQNHSSSVLIYASDSELLAKKNNKRLASKKWSTARILACLAGFMDVRSIRVVGRPVNLCTGNTLRGILHLAEGQVWQAVQCLLIVWGYLCGTVAGRILQNHVQRSARTSSASPLLEASTSMSSNVVGSSRRMVRNDSSSARLCHAVIPWILGLFVLADCLPVQKGSIWAQAVAFGLIHATAQQVLGGIVLFAVTGHYSSLAKNVVDAAWFKRERSASRRRALQHGSMVGSFVAGVILGCLVWNRLPSAYRVGEHTLTGALYGLAFLWCAQWIR